MAGLQIKQNKMASFFTNPSDTNYHSGSSVGPIKNGDTQTSVNEKLAAEIESLRNQLSQLSNSKPVSTTDAIENKSGFGISDTFVSTESKVKVTTKPGAASVDVFYDLTEALGKDTKIFNKVTIEGVKNGLNSIIVDSDKISSGFSLSPDSFPASLSVDLRKKTESGDVFLSAKIALNPLGESSSNVLYARKFGGTDLNTQTKVNDFLFNRLKDVESSSPKEVKLGNETKSLQDAFNTIMNELERLKNQDISSAIVKSGNTEIKLVDIVKSAMSNTTQTSNTTTSNSGIPASTSSSSSSTNTTTSTSSTNTTSTGSGTPPENDVSSIIKDPTNTTNTTPSKDTGSVLDIISGTTNTR